ncbi:hypothetical protein GS429_07060 [Natronorubrum sp. JWXQ-INN-674]|uniref:Uncharacterized protein n=1 Tax=Natronorubrum halalkaliphilum TaxID=2691917 RepID=A0A6B0VJY3_9EURY|nr:hypothetical protein [Natronorubrum halalkaliphilum]MXV61828.1 hypothetical protein [Natronorubrum halalkaliphilum]
MGDNLEGRPTAFCATCDGTEPIKRTVPWQPNICTVCGSNVSASDE